MVIYLKQFTRHREKTFIMKKRDEIINLPQAVPPSAQAQPPLLSSHPLFSKYEAIMVMNKYDGDNGQITGLYF